MSAAKFGHTDVAKLLVDAGADITIQEKARAHMEWRAREPRCLPPSLAACHRARFSFAFVPQWERTALYIACQEGRLEVVHLLAEAGADVNAQHEARRERRAREKSALL